jgi:hypothetical protein
VALAHPPRVISPASAFQPDSSRVVGVPPVDPGALPRRWNIAYLLSMSYKRGRQLVVFVNALVRRPVAVASLAEIHVIPGSPLEYITPR